MHRKFWEAGFRVFGIFGMSNDGRCACGNPNCTAPLKHPMMSNWQHAPVWSEEQFDNMEAAGHFANGFGILCHEILVVDVDNRNGGTDAFQSLAEQVPALAGAGMVVETGSGGGSRHLYFRLPSADLSLMTKHPAFKGIDFKNGAAFVIGPGSKHASGRNYTLLTGSPEEIDACPQELLDLLAKPKHHRASMGDGRTVDVSLADLADILDHIPNNELDYETFIRIGMALHHASDGAAYTMWDNWARRAQKYQEGVTDYKWHSFGKSMNPATLGTLIYYAQMNGWVQPVTFTADPEFQFAEPTTPGAAIDISTVDLKRPPGAVGDIARWIESQTRRPREKLSAVAALVAVGNVCGLRYTDDVDSVTTNLFMFGVAGSGTGKEAVQTAVRDIHAVAGLSPATHGALKSEQEVARNLTRHQMCAYVLDEVGITMKKIKNAQSRGGAPYLDGIIGMLMSAYSKGNGNLLLSGDMKEDVRADLERKLKKADENGWPLASLQHQLATLDQGLEKPFLSVCGFTTLETFNEIMDFHNAANGFIGRSLLAVDYETSPRRKKGFVPREMPENMKMMIRALASGGNFDMQADNPRVEYYGTRRKVPTTPGAVELLDVAADILDDMAEEQKGATGLEALPLRGYEMIAKVSLILAIPEGLRTEDHVRWAYALVRRDIEQKIEIVTANDRVKDDPAFALKSKIMSLLGDDDGETLGVIHNRTRGYRKEDVDSLLEGLVSAGMVLAEQHTHKYKKTIVTKYRRAAAGSSRNILTT